MKQILILGTLVVFLACSKASKQDSPDVLAGTTWMGFTERSLTKESTYINKYGIEEVRSYNYIGKDTTDTFFLHFTTDTTCMIKRPNITYDQLKVFRKSAKDILDIAEIDGNKVGIEFNGCFRKDKNNQVYLEISLYGIEHYQLYQMKSK